MSVLGSDNFNRADSGSLGANWTAIPGGGDNTIVSNQVGVPGFVQCGVIWNPVTWGADHYSQAVWVAASSHTWAVGCRMRDTGTLHMYGGGSVPAESGGGGTAIHLFKYINDAFTLLGTGSGTLAANDVVRLEVQGTRVELFVNGVSKVSVTDSSIASGKAGHRVVHNTSGVGLLDNWEGGDFASTATAPPPFHRSARFMRRR